MISAILGTWMKCWGNSKEADLGWVELITALWRKWHWGLAHKSEEWLSQVRMGKQGAFWVEVQRWAKPWKPVMPQGFHRTHWPEADFKVYIQIRFITELCVGRCLFICLMQILSCICKTSWEETQLFLAGVSFAGSLLQFPHSAIMYLQTDCQFFLFSKPF